MACLSLHHHSIQIVIVWAINSGIECHIICCSNGQVHPQPEPIEVDGVSKPIQRNIITYIVIIYSLYCYMYVCLKFLIQSSGTASYRKRLLKLIHLE